MSICYVLLFGSQSGGKKLCCPSTGVMDGGFKDVLVSAHSRSPELVSTAIPIKTNRVLLSGCSEVGELVLQDNDL